MLAVLRETAPAHTATAQARSTVPARGRVELAADSQAAHKQINVHCSSKLPSKLEAAREMLEQVRSIVGDDTIAAAEKAVLAARPPAAAGQSTTPSFSEALGQHYRLQNKDSAAQLRVAEFEDDAQHVREAPR